MTDNKGAHKGGSKIKHGSLELYDDAGQALTISGANAFATPAGGAMAAGPGYGVKATASTGKLLLGKGRWRIDWAASFGANGVIVKAQVAVDDTGDTSTQQRGLCGATTPFCHLSGSCFVNVTEDESEVELELANGSDGTNLEVYCLQVNAEALERVKRGTA